MDNYIELTITVPANLERPDMSPRLDRLVETVGEDHWEDTFDGEHEGKAFIGATFNFDPNEGAEALAATEKLTDLGFELDWSIFRWEGDECTEVTTGKAHP